MTRVRRRGPAPRRTRLLPEEAAVLRGEPCPPDGNPFGHHMLKIVLISESDFLGTRTEELREAWEYGREELLRQWLVEHPGTRPPGWWRFDAPAARRKRETETAFLKRHHLLEPREREALVS